MKRPRRAGPEVTAGEEMWARDELTETHPEYPAVTFRFMAAPAREREVWEALKDDVVADWIEAHPGTRPARWWELDAPEPRRRLAGTGDPAFEALAYAPRFELGVPVEWVEPWMVEYYNGCARDIHGKPIGTTFSEGDFLHEAFDPADPPTYESEATYLRRLGLLTEGEKEWVPPEEWEPETVSLG